MRATLIAIVLLGVACAAPSRQPAVNEAAPIAETTQGVEAQSTLPPAPAPATIPPPPPTRIAFGSCNDLKQPQLLWERIARLEPAAFVWLGDIVYADTEDIAAMRGLYDELKAFPAYASLAQKTRILGTWDDHDYGRNNAGKEYPKRVESQSALLDFLSEPVDSPRRLQAGVYTAVDLGSDPYRVRVILLDTRYHRDKPGPAGDVLGQEQWAWLRRQLEGSTAAVHLLVSSIQLVPEQHGFEKWSNFPSARARLLSLLDELTPRNVFVISGDRHFAELSKLERGTEKPTLYELTSSSLARPWQNAPDEPNRHRVGDMVWSVNFGLIEVDWAASPRTVRLSVQGPEGPLAIDQTVTLTATEPTKP
jgi:alkaline phosphatase D